MVKTTLNVRWKRLIGSAKVSECCPIAAAIPGMGELKQQRATRPKKIAASRSTRQVIDRGPKMPAREPAAATRTWFSSHSKVSAPTISKLWSLVAFIVSAASVDIIKALSMLSPGSPVSRNEITSIVSCSVSKPMALLSVMELPIEQV